MSPSSPRQERTFSLGSTFARLTPQGLVLLEPAQEYEDHVHPPQQVTIRTPAQLAQLRDELYSFLSELEAPRG